MAKERFKTPNLDGSINIKLSDTRYWNADKRDIINKLISICEDYSRQGYTLTLRQLYYQLVAKDWIPNHDKVYKKLGSLKDEAVYGGLIDWSTFEDRGRVPKQSYYEHSIADAFRRTKSSYRLDKQIGQSVHIEIWTEKDAISGILERVTNPYTLNLVVNKGYSSSTAMYAAYQRFIEAIDNNQKIKVLYFGDHDPSGLDMIRDIEDRIKFMFANGDQFYSDDVYDWWERSGYRVHDIISMDGYEAVEKVLREDYSGGSDEKVEALYEQGLFELYLREHDLFEVIPVGLTKEQIKQYNPPPNPAKITDPRAKGYVAEHGQISWEVDALSPKVMTKIVQDKLLDIMDKVAYDKIVEKEDKDIEKITEIIENINEEN